MDFDLLSELTNVCALSLDRHQSFQGRVAKFFVNFAPFNYQPPRGLPSTSPGYESLERSHR
jgi:hypothetical protein